MLKTRTTGLIVLCLVLNAGLILLVAAGEGALLPLGLHLGALGTCIAALFSLPGRSSGKAARPRIDRWDLSAILGIMALQVGVLIYMSTFPYHYVQDEFITGYTSYSLPSFSEIHWFAGYPPPGEWIAGFSILYYALQKPFIEVLGLSLETVRISTWPYHLLTAALVYLLGKEVFNCRPWAVVAAVVYVLLAPNIYMAGYGMHNISSTFAFLAAFYAAVRMLRDDSRAWAIVCGLFATMGYLTYTSSYLTIPLLLVLVIAWAINEWSLRPLTRFGIALAVVAVGLLPFATYALTQDNYFTQRGDQVNAISAFYDDETVENPTGELLEHIQTNIQALYTPGIGGVTDYWFGHQALFDWFTLGLLVSGLLLGVYRGITHRAILELASVIVVLATFVFGMFLTLPAGGFHRTTLAFPFIALLIVLVIRLITEQVPRLVNQARLAPAFAGVLLAAFVVLNVTSLLAMVREDEEISGLTDSVPITEFVETNVPEDSLVLISAFPHYHLEREIIVRTGDRYDVSIQPFDEVIEHAGETVVILFRPSEDQIHRLEARYAGGQFVDSHNGRDLRRHRVWVPGELATP